MSNQAKRLSDCPAERLAKCRAEAAPFNDEPDFKSDENALEIFFKLMAHKMAKAAAQGRSGWQQCSQEDLSRMLREHVEKGDPVDVANFCMMLRANGFSIAKPALPTAVPVVATVNYTGYEPANHLDWCAPFSLQGLPDGTELIDRAHATRLQAEVSALQQRLNIADQHVSDLEVEVAKLRRGPCELIYGDELPHQGIPGTSFQRLNALANEGE